MKYVFTLATIIILTAFAWPDKNDIDDKLKTIDNYASKIDSNQTSYKKDHWKMRDCFGRDTYTDNGEIVKYHSYQSCFDINFYYEKNKLILVIIDEKKNQGCWTEAHYCLDSTKARDYHGKIYYYKGKLLKEAETGSKPCYPICPSGDIYRDTIDFNNKATIFLKRYGQAKNLK